MKFFVLRKYNYNLIFFLLVIPNFVVKITLWFDKTQFETLNLKVDNTSASFPSINPPHPQRQCLDVFYRDTGRLRNKWSSTIMYVSKNQSHFNLKVK